LYFDCWQIKQNIFLTKFYVRSRISQLVQDRVEPYEPRRIDQGTCVAFEQGVVSRPVDDDPLHLLHVGLPVDLGVGNLLNDEDVDQDLDQEKDARDHVASRRIGDETVDFFDGRLDIFEPHLVELRAGRLGGRHLACDGHPDTVLFVFEKQQIQMFTTNIPLNITTCFSVISWMPGKDI